MEYDDVSSIVDEKLRLADEHYSNFQKYHREKNLSKASEFLWGTLNALFYSLGAMDGKKLSNYNKIKDYLNDLIIQYDDKDILDEYRAAEVLHSNFYHGFLDEEKFDYHYEKVESLIQKLWMYNEKKRAEYVIKQS